MKNTRHYAGLFILTSALLAIAPLAYAQGTDEQTAACSGDAFTLCRADIPDVAKITACMKVHEAQLSPRCRAVFQASDAPRKAPVEQAKKSVEPKRSHGEAAAAKARAPKTVARGAAKQAAKTKIAVERVEPHPRRKAFVVVAPPAPDPKKEHVDVAPVAPAPERIPGLAAYRAGIVSSCEKGLIDPYTCSVSLDSLKSLE